MNKQHKQRSFVYTMLSVCVCVFVTIKIFHRPKLCLEKCDALLSKIVTGGTIPSECHSKSERRASSERKKLSDQRKHSIEKADEQAVEDEIKCIKVEQQNDDAIEEEVKTEPASVQSEQKSSNKTVVPEKYRDILKKSLVVNLIRYKNIDEIINSLTKTTTDSNM